MSGASATRHYAELAAKLTFDQLDDQGVARAKACILDALGCMLAGAGSEDAAIVREAARLDGSGTSAVVGTAERLSGTAAALANGTAGHAFDYDDSSPPMIGHPSVPIMAALVSLSGGRKVTGADIVTAYVAGLEIGAGLGRRMNPAHYAAGWHATATFGTLAATLAGANLLRFDAEHAAHALGVAASSAAGVRKNFGSMAKPLHAGMAARNGVLAVQLAQSGFETDAEALDGANGFIDNFRGDGPMPVFKWDGPLEIVASGVGIKRYPCCGCTHSALDAVLALRSGHGIRGSEVASVHCTMNGLVPDILVHHRPTTPAQAKFSMEYCLAVALLDGACGLDQFDPARVSRGDVQSLLQQVSTSVDPALVYRNGVYPGTVTVTMKDGRVFETSREEALGHPDFPLGTGDLKQKFLECAQRVLPQARAEAAFGLLADLEHLSDFGQLVNLLTQEGDLA